MRTSEHVYARRGELALELTVVEPDGEALERRFGVVLFHGGAWIGGGKGHLLPQAKAIASAGGVTFLPEYRLLDRDHASERTELSVATDVSACVDDAKAAIRWARDHAGDFCVDPDRIAIGGGSAGGHLAVTAALCGQRVDAAGLVLLNPVLDLTNWPSAGPPKVRHAYSPIEHVDTMSPVLILQEDADTVTPPDVVRSFAEMCRAVETPCKVVLYPGVGHGFFNRSPHLEQTNAEIARFLDALFVS
ncbi:MAG: alpha/beta hydrolase [Planctomycetota bacterium]